MITRDHQIVVAVRYEDGLGNASQVVGCRLATAHDCFELGDSCLHRNARVTIDCSFGESREIVIGGAFPSSVRGKNRKCRASLRARAALR